MVDADQVGIYFAAAKIVTCISFVQMAVGAAIARRLSEACQTADRVAFNTHFERGRRMMLWPTMLGASFICILSPFILAVFGPEFPAAVPIVVILSGGILIQAAAGPLQERMMVMGQQKEIASIIAVCLTFNVLASIALTLMLGITGAALASALSIILRIALMRRAALPGPV